MKTKVLERETATQAFHREIEQLKSQLPKDWKLKFILKYPEYDSYRGGLALTSVINLRSTDPVILKGIKEIIEELKAA